MSRQGEVREKIRASLEQHISASGYTQKEIAEKLGVSKSSITNWLKGKNSPDANLVIPICKLLDITIAQFYGEDNATEKKDQSEFKGKSPNTIETEFGKLSVPPSRDVEIGEFTGIKKEAWEMIQRMDDETLAKFIRAAKAILDD